MKQFARVAIAGLTLLMTSWVRADLSDGLVLYYSFDHDQKSVVTDQSGKGNDAKRVGAVFVDKGAVGGAFLFDGASYLAISNSSSLGITSTAMSVAFWIRLHTIDSMQQEAGTILDKADGISGSVGGYFVFWDDRTQNGWTNGIYTSVGQSPLNYTDTHAENAMLDTDWHHYAVVYNSGSNTVYVDGRLYSHVVRYHSGSGPVGTNAYNVYVARNNVANGAPNFLDAYLDELRVYNRALSDGEVAQLAVGDRTPWITQIGFSNATDGDQDVTVFATTEFLYVTASDVNLRSANPRSNIEVRLKQDARKPRKAINLKFKLLPQPDGSFRGSVPLSAFAPGFVRVEVIGKDNELGRGMLLRRAYLTIF